MSYWSSLRGGVSYADDLTLLSPTKIAMKVMIDITLEFAEEFKVTFNPSKSVYLFYPHDNCKTQMTIDFDGQTIVSAETSKHLGHLIGSDSITVQKNAVQKTVGELYGRFNVLMSQFRKCSYQTVFQLFNTFCMSLYGAMLWDYNDNSVERLYTAWRKCVRRIFNLNPRTHCDLLGYIAVSRSINLLLHQRLYNYIRKCSLSKNSLVLAVTKLAFNGSTSTLGSNIKFLKTKYGTTFKCPLQLSQTPNIDNEIKGNIIRELLSYEIYHVIQLID